jgi:hypothetical protein
LHLDPQSRKQHKRKHPSEHGALQAVGGREPRAVCHNQAWMQNSIRCIDDILGRQWRGNWSLPPVWSTNDLLSTFEVADAVIQDCGGFRA